MSKPEKSPMMTHYLNLKEEYKDAVLFYRLGDFYEFFYEDAIEMSNVLDLTLTAKSCGKDIPKAPMCGIPFHSADAYIEKLVKMGYKVAVCEQLTEPKQGNIVERDVVRIISSGTLIEENLLDDKVNNFIVCIYEKNDKYGVSYADLSTGEFKTVEFTDLNSFSNLNDFLASINIGEIICNQSAKEKCENLLVKKLDLLPRFSVYFDWAFSSANCEQVMDSQFGQNWINIFELNQNKHSIIACGALIQYLNEHQKKTLCHINKIQKFKNKDYLTLDVNTKRNLEIMETLKDRRKKGSLLNLLDNTKTAMGARLLKIWLSQPLCNDKLINLRLEAVEELCSKLIQRDSLNTNLSKISDIERIVGRIACSGLNPKHCVNLSKSLSVIPEIKKTLSVFKSKKLVSLFESIEDLSEIADILTRAISTNYDINLKEGGFINPGYNEELDQLYLLQKNAVDVINEMQVEEREKTGIKNLKIDYNRISGYYIEVNKSLGHLVPESYIRKQTISNNERYITPQLKALEEKILNCKELAIKLEQKLFAEIKAKLVEIVPSLQSLSSVIAEIDCLTSFANCAVKNGYVKPTINSKLDHIKIVGGRHPVVESILSKDEFIPNDTYLNTTTDRTMIITGPNMAGKSTYMRQVAIITLLAHIGSFVPATQAEVCVCDRIFTRVGANDDLAFGQSTFMVEMSEVANIVQNATEKSLVILDEIGRGTSTFDGLSIAWAVVEYISNNLKSKTLFATHYHELTELEGVLSGVKNYRISLKEFNGNIIFLRKIVRGGANRSFGIEVASLAGLPKSVIERAKSISKVLEKSDVNLKVNDINHETMANNNQAVKDHKEIINIISEINMNTVSPMTAFEILNDLVEKYKKENQDE